MMPSDDQKPQAPDEATEVAGVSCAEPYGSGRWFKDLESLLFSLDAIREKARTEGNEYFADELDASAKTFRYIVSQAPVKELPPVERFLGCLQNAERTCADSNI